MVIDKHRKNSPGCFTRTVYASVSLFVEPFAAYEWNPSRVPNRREV